MNSPSRHSAAALDWIFSRVERIDLALREHRAGQAVWMHPDRPRGRHLAGLGRQEVEALLPMCRARNAHGADVFWRPARGAAAVVLLDDVLPTRAVAIAAKYATLAVETSHGNAQLWIALDEPVDATTRHHIQTELIRRIGADPGASGGVQLGRLPGFRNRKPGYAADPPWVNLLMASDEATLDPRPLFELDTLAGGGTSRRLSPPPQGAGAVAQQAQPVTPKASTRGAARARGEKQR